MIWIGFTVLIAIAVAFAAAPLLNAGHVSPKSNERARCYARQLAEIERDAADGAISQSEAEALKTEASRRLIAESSTESKMEQGMENPRPVAAVAMAAIVAAAGVGLYAIKGSPQTPSVQRTAALSPNINGAATSQADIGSVDNMIEGLKSRLAEDSGNADGWRMLGWSYFNIGRYKESADAYAKAVRLDPLNASYQSAYGEALVMAASGFVTPAALEAFDAALAGGADDPRAKFFKALALDQAGDPKAAINAWIELANSAEPDADWLDGLVKRIRERAVETGIDVSGRLKAREVLAIADLSAPGPTLAQIQSAQTMPAADQQEMIAGMVERLAARLRDNPDNAEGWVRLIRSRMVLGERADAARDLRSALAAFEDQPDVRSRIEAEAKALGVSIN